MRILHTRDTLREIILESLDYVSDTLVPRAKDEVSKFAGSSVDLIDTIFDQAIDALGGRSQTVAGEISFTSRMISAIETSGIPDTIEWIVAKVLNSLELSLGSRTLAYASIGKFEPDDPDEDEKLLAFWKDTLVDGLENVVEIPEGVLDILITLQKNPDEPQIALVELLELFHDQAVGLIQFGEKVILGLLDLMTYLIKTIRKILSTKIRIPFISDILEWFGLPGDLGFSILDAITLIMAIPITAIYKAFYHETPFKDTSLTLAQAEDKILTIIASVCDILGAAFSMFLDGIPETDTGKGTALLVENPSGKSINPPDFFEIITWATGVTSWVANWFELLPNLFKKSSDRKKSLEKWLCGFEGCLLILDLFYAIWGYFISTKKVERFKRGIDKTIWPASVFGAIHLVLAVVNGISDEEEDVLDVIFTALQIFPEVIPFLRLPEYYIEWGMVIPGADYVSIHASLYGMIWKLSKS